MEFGSRIKCRACGHRSTVASAAAGTRIRCAGCGRLLLIPGAEEPGTKDLDPVPSPRRWSRWAAAAAVALAAVSAGAFYFIRLTRARAEAEAFARLQREPTTDGAESFLKQYPESEHAAMARTIAERTAFDAAAKKDTLEAYRAYMSRFPSGEHWREADRIVQDESQFRAAAESNDATALKRYMEERPAGRHAAEAADRIEFILFSAATKGGDRELRDYLKIYPSGKNSAAARQRLDGLDFDLARTTKSADGYDRYLSLHPDGAHAAEARQGIDDLRFEAARFDNTVNGFKAFLEKNPDSRHAAEARQLFEAKSYEIARSVASEKAYDEYLERFPDGAHAAEIAEKLYDLARRGSWPACDAYAKRCPKGARAAEIDDLLFGWAKKDGNTGPLENYLTRFPDGRHADEARSALEDLLYAAVASTTSAGLYEAYLSKYPQGRHAAEVRGWLADEREYEKTEKDPSLESLDAYLSAFPNGRHATRVRYLRRIPGAPDEIRQAAKKSASALADRLAEAPVSSGTDVTFSGVFIPPYFMSEGVVASTTTVQPFKKVVDKVTTYGYVLCEESRDVQNARSRLQDALGRDRAVIEKGGKGNLEKYNEAVRDLNGAVADFRSALKKAKVIMVRLRPTDWRGYQSEALAQARADAANWPMPTNFGPVVPNPVADNERIDRENREWVTRVADELSAIPPRRDFSGKTVQVEDEFKGVKPPPVEPKDRAGLVVLE